MTCYHYRQPGHMRRDCPRRQRSHDTTETEAFKAAGYVGYVSTLVLVDWSSV